MKRLLDIYLTYQKWSIKKLYFYKLSALFQFLNLIVWIIIDLIFFQAVFGNVGSFSGWTYWDAVLLMFTLSLFWDIFWRVTSGGIVSIPEKIFNGEINKYLLKPINPLFHLSIAEIGVLDNSLNTPILLLYYWLNQGFPFSLLQIIIYFVVLVLGVAIFSWILLTIVSLAFWVTNVEYLAQVYWELQNIARYPKDIFSGFLGNLFMFVLPVFFVANIPVDVLRNGINLYHILVAILLNVILGSLSLLIWKLGLKRYNGVSG